MITDEHVKTACQPGNGAKTCRYLGTLPDGWTCLKLTPAKVYIDNQVMIGNMTARGDNCDGSRDGVK